MKAIACAIMFGIIWNTPPHLWNEFTEFSKQCIVVFAFIMWCGFTGFLGGEKS